MQAAAAGADAVGADYAAARVSGGQFVGRHVRTHARTARPAYRQRVRLHQRGAARRGRCAFPAHARPERHLVERGFAHGVRAHAYGWLRVPQPRLAVRHGGTHAGAGDLEPSRGGCAQRRRAPGPSRAQCLPRAAAVSRRPDARHGRACQRAGRLRRGAADRTRADDRDLREHDHRAAHRAGTQVRRGQAQSPDRVRAPGGADLVRAHPRPARGARGPPCARAAGDRFVRPGRSCLRVPGERGRALHQQHLRVVRGGHRPADRQAAERSLRRRDAVLPDDQALCDRRLPEHRRSPGRGRGGPGVTCGASHPVAAGGADGCERSAGGLHRARFGAHGARLARREKDADDAGGQRLYRRARAQACGRQPARERGAVPLGGRERQGGDLPARWWGGAGPSSIARGPI